MPLDSFPAFHGTRRFNTEFTGAVPILSQTNPVHICHSNNEKIRKSTVVIDGTQKDCNNKRNRMQPSKIKIKNYR
jgi:hypothetical protein